MKYLNTIEELMAVMREFFSIKGDLFGEVINRIYDSLKSGHKILVFGNGGSAAQAQHFAAELVNKFVKERAPIRAISLTTDTSALTSIANDSSYENVFGRQIEALGDKGDIALGLSTSGNSLSVIEAIKLAKQRGLTTIAITGKGGGKLASWAEFLLDIPSKNTPRIQEVHLLLLHLIAKEIEDKLS